MRSFSNKLKSVREIVEYAKPQGICLPAGDVFRGGGPRKQQTITVRSAGGSEQTLQTSAELIEISRS